MSNTVKKEELAKVEKLVTELDNNVQTLQRELGKVKTAIAD